MSDCEYCALTEPGACCAEDSGWVCTRPPGHSGEHVACHTDRHQLHTWQHATAWPDEADKASKRQVGGDHYARLVIQPAKYNHANNIPFIEARQQIEAAQRAADQTEKAAEAHYAVKRWTAARDLLAPTGIPAELLSAALEPVNQTLAQLAQRAGWKIPTLDGEMQISVGGLPYPLLSESAQWRVDALMALTLAHTSGLGIVFLDRFDVLDLPGRNQALALMRELAGEFVDQAWLFGTLKAAPQVEGVTTLWLGDADTKREVA